MKGGLFFPINFLLQKQKPTEKRAHIEMEKTNLRFFDSSECEIAETEYYPEGLPKGQGKLRVIFIRAPKKVGAGELLLGEYDTYPLVSNLWNHQSVPNKKASDWKLVPATAEAIINFYRTRGNTENFIREQKYGLDLKHYPCQKLSANKVYGLIACLAYNLMRASSFLICKSGCFFKKIRFHLVHIPCQIAVHARTLQAKFEAHKKRRWKRSENTSLKSSVVLQFRLRNFGREVL